MFGKVVVINAQMKYLFFFYFTEIIHTPQAESAGPQEIYEKQCHYIIEKCKFLILDVQPYLTGKVSKTHLKM